MNGLSKINAVVVAVLGFASTFGASTPKAPDRPNVIVIMTDDQGYGDFGATGNRVIRTPHLDRMAAGGVRMTRFYVSPVCTPTRACLMTGRYNYRTRAIDTFVGRAMMEPEEVTVAEVLRDAGYATGIFGKWHLGDCYPLRAIDQGFEEALVHRGGGIGQPSDPPEGKGRYTDAVLFHNGKQVQTKGYCTDVYFDAAMEWIEKNHARGRSFFAYIPTNAPHFPAHDVPQGLYKQYKKAEIQSIMLRKHNAKSLRDNIDNVARVFAMITNIDDNVGRLFRKLERLDIIDDTLVIFLTDNGPNSRRYVGPLRGMKGDVHEGGVRTVFFAHWRAQLQAGRTCSTLAAHIDIMPTVLDVCGVATPSKVKLDGRSILPLLKGQRVCWPDRTIFIQAHRGNKPVLYHHFCAVGQRWKLVNASGFGRQQLPGPPEFKLYDLCADPGERNNLAKQHRDIAERLKRQYELWFEDVSSTRPDNYAPPRIHVGTPHENPTVLTRQDWRHTDGRPWAPDSNGRWLLHVAAAGTYDVRLRFDAEHGTGSAMLMIGAQKHVLPLDASAAECLFEHVQLQAGDTVLRTQLTYDDKAKGTWQAEVIKR